MGIIVDGTILSARGAGLSSIINGYISKKQQTLQSLYEQQAAIEDMYNSVASGLYTAQSSIYQLNSYYNNQIMSKNSTINHLQAQIRLADNKISALNSMHNSLRTTVTSLDDFLTSVRASANASSTFDFSNTNPAALDVSLINTTSLNTQRIEYNVKQVATSTQVTSYTLNGYNITNNTKIKDLFAGTYDSSTLTGTRNDLNESMTMKQLGISEGYWDIGTVSLYIGENDTLGHIAQQLNDEGYKAGIKNGQFYIDGRNTKAMNIRNGESNFGEVLGLTVSTGDFLINGQTVNIDNTTTIQNLLDTINDINSDYGVGAYFENNQLMLVSNLTGNVLIEIEKGTSSFTNVAGFTVGGKMITDNLTLGSDGSKYTLTGSNNVSSVSEISAGEFVLSKTHNGITSKEAITVTQGATLQDTLNNVIAAINASSLSLTASIENDKFVIQNNDVGSEYEITIESGDSDFTEKLGFTNPLLSSGTPSYDENTNYFTTLTGITDIASIDTANVVTAGSFKINGTTINLSAGSLRDAINTINSFTNQTGVIADYVGNHIILRNEYTGDTNFYVDGGTSNFGEIAGFTTQSINTGAATIGQLGSKTTLTGSEIVSGTLSIEDSVLTINGTTVNIAAGQLSDVVNQLNTNYSDTLNVTFSISPENKLVITEKRNGELPISVSSVSGNFAALTGIAGYQSVIGTEEKYGSTRTTYTTARNVTSTTQILDSTVEINGHQMELSGNISDAILTINSRSSITGVEAFIDSNNKFTLRNTTAGSTGITFNVLSGDFGRVVGTGFYDVEAGSASKTGRTVATVTGARDGLTEFSEVLAGSKIQFGATIIDLGASVGAALLAINNNKDITGVEALLNSDGQFVLRSTNEEMESISFAVIGTGDFGRVTGLGTYTVGAAESNGEVTGASYSTLTGANNVTNTTEITATSITIGFTDHNGVNEQRTFELEDGTLEDAMRTINESNWYVKAEIENGKLQIVSRNAGNFNISLTVNPVEVAAGQSVSGDFGRVVGMGSLTTLSGSLSSLDKNPATHYGSTTGLSATDELIGTNSITLWMTHTYDGSNSLASSTQTITFVDKDSDGTITLQDAIDSINEVKHLTKIEASLVNGQFVLTQTDANTGTEGDTINFTVGGNGDFGRVAGLSAYTTVGQSNTGSVSGRAFTTLTGSRDISTTNEVLAGSFTLTFTKGASANSPAVDISTTINITDGTIADTITSINNQLAAANIEVTASVTDGKLQFKADRAGDYNIAVNMNNSDFGRVVGIGSHTTSDGSYTSVEKTAAKITGGVTGLTRDSQLLGTMQLTLQGIVTRTTTGVNAVGGTNNAASSVRTITLSGTIGDAIDAINEQTASTQIRAYLDANGRFILEQTNHNTVNEFDTISFSLSGTGDFGATTGLGAYTAYGQESEGSTTGQSYSYIAGLTNNLKGTEQITAGTITINFKDNVNSWQTPTEVTLNVNIDGTVEKAVTDINNAIAAAGYTLRAEIDEANGKFTIKSTSFGQDEISVSVTDSDFGRVTGIANYTMDYATVTGASSTYDLHPVLTGSNAIDADMRSLNGTLVIDGNTISTVNKTLLEIAQEVNDLGVAGVTADVETGYFRIKMLESEVGNPVSVEATGDFARLTGLGDYSVGQATYVAGSYTLNDGTPSYLTKSVTGLSDTAKFVGGDITIYHDDGQGNTVSFTVSTTGKTAQQVAQEINTIGTSGTNIQSTDGYSLNYVYATYENNQITIKTNENSHRIEATGDFARVTGFSEYRTGGATTIAATTSTEQGTLQYTTQSTTALSSSTRFTDGLFTISFTNGVNGTETISVNTANKTLGEVVSEINTRAAAYSDQYSHDGWVVSRPFVTFNESTGKISVVTYDDDHTITATGNFDALTGFSQADYVPPTAMRDVVTYNQDGTLTGSVTISDVSNGQAIIGQAGTIDFYKGSTKIASITVEEDYTLERVLQEINAMSENNPAPTDTSNLNYNENITASIVDGKIQLQYGAGIDNLTVSGTSSFVYFYGLGSSETLLPERSTEYNVNNQDVYIYSNGSITGSVDVKTMLSTGSLTVGATEIGPFCGQQNGVLTFVSTIGGTTQAVGNVEILATDTLDDVMNKINNMVSVDATTPDGVVINRINGFTASFTADGKIQITYGGQQGLVKIQDTSGFAQYYGLTDSSQSIASNYTYEEAERPCPDSVGQSVVTGSSKGYNDNFVVGGLQSGTMSVSLNGKTINVSYSNTESLSVILGRMIETANKTDGSGLFDYNGDLDSNINPITDDKMTFSINAEGQIVISAGVESRTEDQLVITDLSGNFARLTGIATTPDNYTPVTGTFSGPATPGLAVYGTDYYVTTHSQTGNHGTFSYTGTSINGLSGDSVISGVQTGGFYLETTNSNSWITVNEGDSVNTVLARINALDSSNINATFDETNNRIKITATNNALARIHVSGDTSGFTERVGLESSTASISANYTSTQESYGHSIITSSVENLHTSHILGNIQGGINTATETVTLTDGAGSVNITVSDDESLSSIIQKIQNTSRFDAGITDGKLWIKSLADSSEAITVSESNFARILGFDGGNETLSNGVSSVGSYGTMTYTGAAVAGLLGSSNLTIDSSYAGAGDGSFTVTLSDKTSDTITVAPVSFNVSVTKDMTVDDIMSAIRTASVNAGITGLDITFDSSTHQVKASIDGNKAEQITFSGIDEKGTELIKRLGLSTSNSTWYVAGTNTKEGSGYSRLTGSVTGLHGNHIMSNLTSSSFTISGAGGTYSINLNTASGPLSLNQIITQINTQTSNNYTAGIDSDGKFYIQSNTKSNTNVTITSANDFTKRVGLTAANESYTPQSNTVGSYGTFEFYGAGGTGGAGIDGMTGSTVFTGLEDGSFNFTLGATSINTPTGEVVYHNARTFTIDVSSTDTVQSVLNKMQDAIEATDEYSNADLNFEVDVTEYNDGPTPRSTGRIHIQMNGKDASEIVFSDDNTNFVQLAGLSNVESTIPADFTSVNRSYGKSVLTGSVQNLNNDHVFGNMTAGTMVVTAGAITKSINVLETDSISDIATKLSEGGLFTAGLDENGSFFVKTVDDNASNITVSGTSDFHKIVGLNSGSWTYSATTTTGSYGNSKITGSLSGLTENQKFNNVTSGNFTISAAGLSTLTVNVTAGNTRVSDILAQINTPSGDYEAALVDGHLVINTKTPNGATIVVSDGTSNYAQVVGLTSGTISNAANSVTGVSDIFTTITGSTTGLDRNSTFAPGDFIISVKDPFGSVTSHTFSISDTDTLDTIIARISNPALGLGISASIDSSTKQLVLKAKNAGAYEIEIIDGTANFAEATGLTRNHGQIQETQRGTLASITSSKTAQNASLLGYTTGTFYVSLTDKNGNITDTEQITIELDGTEPESVESIAQKITASSIGIKAEVNAVTGRLELTRKSSTTEGGIAVTKGTSDFTNKIGLTMGGEQSSAAEATNGTDEANAVYTGAILNSATGTTELGALGITSGTIVINNKAINILETDDINTLITKINNQFNASDPSGVTASFSGNRIVLTSNQKATNATINIETGSSNASYVLGLTNSAATNTSIQALGLNAKITINGVEHESRSNDFAIDGNGNITSVGSSEEALRLTLKEIGNGIVDIGHQSVEETYLKLLNFANCFNSSMIIAQNAALADDTGFQSLITALRGAMTDDVGSIRKVERELNNIGISLYSTLTATGGTRMSMVINKDKFENAMLTNTENVLNLLIGNDSEPLVYEEAGSFTRLKATIDETLKPISGYFKSNARILESQKKAMLKEVNATKGELAQLEAELAIVEKDNDAVKQKEELENFLQDITEQYKTISSLIEKVNKQYTQSLSVLVVNKANPSFQ